METQLRHRTAVRPNALRDAFTLIEMMVVVALIGILIGGVFRLLSAAGEGAKRAETIERMQRVENAISGFYATYGTYPPVPRHGSPDPFAKEDDQGNTTPHAALTPENANRAAACQPVPFEFPPMKALDDFIATKYKVTSPNMNPGAFEQGGTWPTMKLYRYGLVSFLIPRYDAIGEFKLEETDGYTPKPISSDWAPHEDLYTNHKLWKDVNPAAQAKAEREACARWLPNLERTVLGGRKLLGVETGVRLANNEEIFNKDDKPYNHNGNTYFLRRMTIQDSWGNDLFYYSAPPYQSYRLWSAGPDKNTFPADYPLTKLSTSDRKTVGGWIKDDIVRASR